MSAQTSGSPTRIDEIADGVFRISTKIDAVPGGFTFNQYLIRDEAPALFHTGPHAIHPLVRDAIATVLPPQSLRYVGFSHVEADECGSLADFLALAPNAVALCGQVAAMISGSDLGPRPAKALAEGETLSLGAHTLRWLDAPHVPHGWDCGFAFEEATRTLLCGDLFTQPGGEHPALTDGDILGPSEAMRAQMGHYFSNAPHTGAVLEKLARTEPQVLACMHGAAWRGDGAALIRELGSRLSG